MWMGPVGLAETNSRLILWPASASEWPKPSPASMTLLTILACADASRRMLMKPGSGHLRRGDTVGLCQRLGEPSGQLTRVGADLLAELQRQVAGVIAVLGNARPLHGDRRRQRGSVQPTLGQHRGGGGFEQLGQVSGGHERPSYWLRCPRPESIAVAKQPPAMR